MCRAGRTWSASAIGTKVGWVMRRRLAEAVWAARYESGLCAIKGTTGKVMHDGRAASWKTS